MSNGPDDCATFLNELIGAGVDTPYARALERGGIRTWEDLAATNDGHLRLLHGMSYAGLRQIRRAQSSRNGPGTEPRLTPPSGTTDSDLAVPSKISITTVELSDDARRALVRAGIHWLHQLVELGRAQLMALPGASVSVVRELERIRAQPRSSPPLSSEPSHTTPTGQQRSASTSQQDFKPTSLSHFLQFLFAPAPSSDWFTVYAAGAALDRLEAASIETISSECGIPPGETRAVQRKAAYWLGQQWEHPRLAQLWKQLHGILMSCGGAATTPGLVRALQRNVQTTGINPDQFVEFFYQHCPKVTRYLTTAGVVWAVNGLTPDTLDALRDAAERTLESVGGSSTLSELHARIRSEGHPTVVEETLQAALTTSDRFSVTDSGWVELLERPMTPAERLLAALRKRQAVHERT